MSLKLPALAGGLVVVAGLAAGLWFSITPGESASSQGSDYRYLSTRDLQQLSVRLGGTNPVKPTGDVKEFTLVAQQADWELLPGVMTTADTFNGAVPGPTIRVTEGDTVRVTVRNELPQETSIHWHGLHIPNEMDGVAGVTQEPIMPGETFHLRVHRQSRGDFHVSFALPVQP